MRSGKRFSYRKTTVILEGCILLEYCWYIKFVSVRAKTGLYYSAGNGNCQGAGEISDYESYVKEFFYAKGDFESTCSMHRLNAYLFQICKNVKEDAPKSKSLLDGTEHVFRGSMGPNMHSIDTGWLDILMITWITLGSQSVSDKRVRDYRCYESKNYSLIIYSYISVIERAFWGQSFYFLADLAFILEHGVTCYWSGQNDLIFLNCRIIL